MTTARKDVQTAIVLQGGGALGADEYGVLRALYEQRPGFRPVAVAGVSIGAITAAVLGGAWTGPIPALDDLWRTKLTVTAPTGPFGLPAAVDRSLALLGNPGMYRLHAGLFTAPWLLTSLYDTAPLRQTLAELVDPLRLNADDPRVIVGATNVGGAVLGRRPVLQHPARPGDQRTRTGGGRRPRGGARAHRRRAVPDAGGGAADDARRPATDEVRAYRRIDHLNVVTSSLPPELSNASDFSRASVEARIQAGYDDAIAQGIGSPRAPGLRFGVMAPAVDPVHHGAGPALLV